MIISCFKTRVNKFRYIPTAETEKRYGKNGGENCRTVKAAMRGKNTGDGKKKHGFSYADGQYRGNLPY